MICITTDATIQDGAQQWHERTYPWPHLAAAAAVSGCPRLSRVRVLTSAAATAVAPHSHNSAALHIAFTLCYSDVHRL